MSRRALVLPLLLACTVASCSLWRPGAPVRDFVRVQGTQFFLGDRPYYFAGTNLWSGCYLGSPGPTGDRPRLLRELDTLHTMGLLNLRVLAASEESYIRRSLKPAIQRAPGDLDEDLLVGLDFLLGEMGKRRMHAVIFLSNYWEWSGGMAQYVTWADGRTAGVDPEEPTQGWGAFMNYSATFYSNERAMQLYRDFARSIILRTNTITGVRYIDDPTIMAWQLANEPRPGTDDSLGERNLDVFYAWIDSTARFIKSLDPNHLVSAGSEGTVGTLKQDAYYIRAYTTPSIDYLNLHLWPYNWGWYNPRRIIETIDTTETNALAYIRRHYALARTIGKPLTMEEFGLARDSLRCEPGSPVTARNRYFRKVFNLIADSAEAGAPIAGTNFWGWGGEGSAQHADFRWRSGDSFVGDPPQEPQGLNSVFNADIETKDLIRAHAWKMAGLRSVSPQSRAGR